VKMTDFVLGPYQTALEPDEIIVAVEVPRWDVQGTYVLKVGGASYPSLILSLAARLEDGIVKESRLAVGGYYTRPFVVEGAFDGEKLSEDAAVKAVGLFPDGEPYDDPHLAFEKKRQMLPTALTRLIREASAGQWRLPIREEITRWRGRDQEPWWLTAAPSSWRGSRVFCWWTSCGDRAILRLRGDATKADAERVQFC